MRRFIEAQEVDEIKALLASQASEYWNDHYRFDKSSDRKYVKKLSSTWIEMLIINVVAPLLFIYGNHKGDQELKNKAISFLEDIPAEKNSIINTWRNLGVKCNNALQSQGSLRLKKEYCSEINCMKCSIGNELLKF